MREVFIFPKYQSLRIIEKIEDKFLYSIGNDNFTKPWSNVDPQTYIECMEIYKQQNGYKVLTYV